MKKNIFELFDYGFRGAMIFGDPVNELMNGLMNTSGKLSGRLTAKR